MGQSLGELYAELSLKTDKLHDGIEKSNRELAKLEQDIDKTVESINAKLAAIGAALSASVTLPLTLLGKAALDTFTNFEQSMQNTFSVMGASASEMEALRKKAEDMGATTRFSASQAADALYSLGSAGQSAAQAMNSLDGVLQLAGATGSDLAFTSSTIASTLSQFNLSAEKSAHIADVFSLAISKSQANMTKLSYSMKYVGPVAAGLGVSLEASTAALMRLYNTGFGGEQAGTILRSGLQKLASGTDDVKKKLEALGVSYDEVNPKTNNFADMQILTLPPQAIYLVKRRQPVCKRSSKAAGMPSARWTAYCKPPTGRQKRCRIFKTLLLPIRRQNFQAPLKPCKLPLPQILFLRSICLPKALPAFYRLSMIYPSVFKQPAQLLLRLPLLPVPYSLLQSALKR